MNFWKELPSPVFALAPMEDVTDTVFREVVMSVSSEEVLKVMFTEFTSTDGLMHKKGSEKVAGRLIVSAPERELLRKKNIKLVAQIWGNDPEKFATAAQLITGMDRFDGIDINMGCPVKKVVKKNTCSALIAAPELARELILATKENSSLPVSVKTRIGISHPITEMWIGKLLETCPAAIIIHGRTQKMQSEGNADWNEIGNAVQLRDRMHSDTKIIGNGDVESYGQGLEYVSRYGVDGIMIGRGIFKSPWLFNKKVPEPDVDERLHLLMKHLGLFTSFWKESKNFHILRRFFKIYVSGFPGAGSLRADLMNTHSEEEVREILDRFRVKETTV
jgi:tRNA-dihydrouridine synthase